MTGRGEGGGSVPAICFCLKAMSSSSSSPAGFFLGFLLWMGLVPAVSWTVSTEKTRSRWRWWGGRLRTSLS